MEEKIKEIKDKCKWATGYKNIWGYLGFEDANYLVSTKRFMFCSVGCWGYVVEEIK